MTIGTAIFIKDFPYLLERTPHFGGVPPKLIKVNLEKNPHALVIGGSGSGKSFASQLYCSKAKLHNPDLQLYIVDFKGDDMFTHIRITKGARYYQYKDSVLGLETFSSVLRERLEGNQDRRPVLLWIDEISSFIQSLGKQDAERAKAMYAEVLNMGRSMKCFSICSVQRASAELFALGSRDNFSLNLAMGNLSKESAATISLEREAVLPVTRIGGGTLILDGVQQAVQVPLIDGIGLEKMKATLLKAVTE